MKRLVEALRGIEGRVVICGVDRDRNWSASEGQSRVLDMIGDKFWQQVVRGPTHRYWQHLGPVHHQL